VERSDGSCAASANGPRRDESKVGARALRFILVAGRWLLVCNGTGEATDSVRTTVKSFVALSVRATSSGNSPATIPHNSRRTNAVMRILPRPACPRVILWSPVSQVIHVSGMIGKRYLLSGGSIFRSTPRQEHQSEHTFIDGEVRNMLTKQTPRLVVYGTR
jgi:hypothetical protein